MINTFILSTIRYIAFIVVGVQLGICGVTLLPTCVVIFACCAIQTANYMLGQIDTINEAITMLDCLDDNEEDVNTDT